MHRLGRSKRPARPGIPDDIGKVCDVSLPNDLTYSRTLRLAMSPYSSSTAGRGRSARSRLLPKALGLTKPEPSKFEAGSGLGIDEIAAVVPRVLVRNAEAIVICPASLPRTTRTSLI